MKILFVLLSVVINQQLSHGAKLCSFGPLDMRTPKMHSLKNLPQFADLARDEKRDLFIYEQTIVIRDTGFDNEVHRCEVIEVYTENETAEALTELESLLNLKVQKFDMEGMMDLLRDCDSVDELGYIDDEDEKSKKKPDSPNAFGNGIFPGTKWCGSGDIANSFHDLGKLHNVDRCCRSHDFCPIKVLKKDQRYNLTNTAMYTKSHCLCDEAFYDCLKRDNGWSAKFIGNLYFYAASPKCVIGVPGYGKENMKFIPATKEWLY